MNKLFGLIKPLFRYSLNFIFSNNSEKLVQLKLSNRYQLVWISEYVGRKIALRTWETAESNFFQNFLRDDDVCIDIGANIGYYTHLFAHKVRAKGTVISIEPLKKNAFLIELNSIINDTDNFVKVLCTAVSDSENAILNFSNTADSAFSFVVSDSSQSRVGSNHIKPGVKITEIPTTTIDCIIDRLCIKKVDIIKMDVEGFEYKVLMGMKRLLSSSSSRPRLMMIELLSEHLKYYNNSISEICLFLEKYGYSSKFLFKGHLYDYNLEHYDKVHNVFFVLDA